MNIPNSLLRCPNCHSKLIGIWTIHSNDYSDILFIYGYCPSLKCRIRKVTFDKNLRVLSTTRFSSLEKKKEVIAKILEKNYKNYSLRMKRKLRDKYEKLCKNKANKNKNK